MVDVKDEEFDFIFLDEDGIDVDVFDVVLIWFIYFDKDMEILKWYLICKIFLLYLELLVYYYFVVEEF